MKKQQNGFTLIELAIVLVIIGLLLGGVLKGQELINSAKVKNMASDFKNTQVYIYGYQDRFKALPGDDRAASTHIPGATNAAAANIGNGVINGQWDSQTTSDESFLFWQHVRLAGFAAGTTTFGDATQVAAYLPTNADGGRIGVQSVSTLTAVTPISTANPTGISGSFAVCSGGVLGKFAKQLDTTLDDGETSTGSMRAVVAGTPGIGVTSATVVDANPYIVCLAF
jgi:prepilin-type N-terminal cleavage/methylation domain-containing protein